MPNKAFIRVCAVLVCLALGLAMTPVLSAVERAPKASFQLLLKQPSWVLTLLFPWVRSEQERSVTAVVAMKPSLGRVRPTNDLSTPKPSGGN
jgi:DTW domain-containing protein YfiP